MGLALGETVVSPLGAALAVLAGGDAGAGAIVGGGGTCFVDAVLCPPQADSNNIAAAAMVRSGSRVISLFSDASPIPCSRQVPSTCPMPRANPWSSVAAPAERPRR